ncbi:MAG: pitrilysin family protein [Thermodesulfobacteriota bacterium]|nr:pitrilysin family protein [Thermodesulfobacteriota bacterium]
MLCGRRLFQFFLIFCFSGATLAGATTSLEQKVEQFHLDNGLTVLVVERHDSPTFTAYMTVGVGSADEDGANRGVAHLLEHMRFKGTQTIGTQDYAAEKPLIEAIDKTALTLQAAQLEAPVDEVQVKQLRQQLTDLQQQQRQLLVKDEFSKIYARQGGVGFNAFTGKDLTSYLISLPANKLELWMSLEADRMENAVLREFYTERDVVLEERRRSYESKPSGMMYEALLATAFRVHPYRHPVIGWNCDINNLSKEETADFLHRYYAPINTVIAIVGDVDVAEVKALLERYFAHIAPGEKIPPVTAIEPPQRGERRTEVRFDAQPQLLVAFHKPTLPTRDDYAFDLLGKLLTEGPTSLLYKHLVLEQQLATSVSSYGAPGGRYPNLFVISATPRQPHTTAELEQAIYKQLEQLKHQLVDDADLMRIRKRLRADRLRYLRTNNGMANMLSRYQVIAGGWRYLTDYDQQVATITAKDVQQAVKRWLNVDNRTVITLVQEK